MSAEIEQPHDQYEVTLATGGTFTVVVAADGSLSFLVGQLCRHLKMATQPQTDKLQRARLFRGYVRRFYVKTRGGTQPTVCLHEDALPMWLGTIDDSRLSDEAAEGLLPWQRTLMADARRLWREHNGGKPAAVTNIIPITPSARDRRLSTDLRSVERFVIDLERRVGDIEERLTDTDGE